MRVRASCKRILIDLPVIHELTFRDPGGDARGRGGEVHVDIDRLSGRNDAMRLPRLRAREGQRRAGKRGNKGGHLDVREG
jgi:hypothetical protein